MKTIKTFITIIFIFTIYNVNSQSQKITELEKNRVRLFSMEEFSNLSLWFYNELNEMKLTEDLENQYKDIIVHLMPLLFRMVGEPANKQIIDIYNRISICIQYTVIKRIRSCSNRRF